MFQQRRDEIDPLGSGLAVDVAHCQMIIITK